MELESMFIIIFIKKMNMDVILKKVYEYTAQKSSSFKDLFSLLV